MNLQASFCDYVDVSDEIPAGSEAEAILNELLVLRCRRGDADGWRQLVRHWEKRLLYYLRRLLNDERDAWDVLQQTWIDVFRNLRTLENPRALRSWLYRIAYRKAISCRRAKAPDQPSASTTEPTLDDVPDPASEAEDMAFETVEQVHNALDRLSLSHREVITLFFLEEMSIEEISAVLSVPAGTVKSRLHYAKLELRDCLKTRSRYES